MSSPDAFYFDEQKLIAAGTTEKQEIFLFQWLAHLERELKTASQEVLKTSQYLLEKTLLRIISLSSVKSRRPIRRLIARVFVLLYTRGETRTLFDTVTTLHGLVPAGKTVEKEAKVYVHSFANGFFLNRWHSPSTFLILFLL